MCREVWGQSREGNVSWSAEPASEREDQTMSTAAARAPLAVGDRVVLPKGNPYQSLTAVVKEVTENDVLVTVEMFGRVIEQRLPLATLAPGDPVAQAMKTVEGMVPPLRARELQAFWAVRADEPEQDLVAEYRQFEEVALAFEAATTGILTELTSVLQSLQAPATDELREAWHRRLSAACTQTHHWPSALALADEATREAWYERIDRGKARRQRALGVLLASGEPVRYESRNAPLS